MGRHMRRPEEARLIYASPREGAWEWMALGEKGKGKREKGKGEVTFG